MVYIFDLGGVLVNLNMKATNAKARKMLSLITLLRGKEYIKREIKSIYKEYEKGHLTSEEFINRFSKHCHPWISKNEVKQWWLSMLLDLPEQRKAAIRKLKEEGHTVYLLSNTSELHWQYCLDTYFAGENISDYFDRLFLSYEIGLRKPDPAIYEYLIEKTGINPAEAVYFDDLPANVQGGLNAGLQAKQVIGDEWITVVES